jgi:hypothetical protein
VSGIKKYGDKHTIIGDTNAVKNGWLYAVWGNSLDPNTWQEQNITINGIIRPLRRYIITKTEQQVEEEKTKSELLDQKHNPNANRGQ